MEEHTPSSAQEDEQQQALQFASLSGLERPATVLLSYAHEDTEAVRDLQLRLNVRGLRCWRDEDNLLPGTHFESVIVEAIEHNVDAMALYITPNFLNSHFIWKIEVPAALRRHKHDPGFSIVPILQGVSFAEVRQHCFNYNLPDLSSFHGIVLTDDDSSTPLEQQHAQRNQAARRILRSALALRLRRANADRRYELRLCLRTFVFEPLTETLDLDLNWLQLVHEKESVPTPQEWEQILLPALEDVKQAINETRFSRRIHLFVQSILPVALALGFAFRESSRLTLFLEGQKETWRTDIPVSEEEPLQCTWNYNKQGDSQEAVIEVATTRPTQHSVAKALFASGMTPGYHIQLEARTPSREAVRDAAHAQAIAQQVGRICQDLCDRRSVTHLHLFVAIPVELAVLIGYQLNALCPITLYNFTKQGAYTEVGTISQ